MDNNIRFGAVIKSACNKKNICYATQNGDYLRPSLWYNQQNIWSKSKWKDRTLRMARVRNLQSGLICCVVDKRVSIRCKAERSGLALKMGPFRWVKYSPILKSNLAALNQGQCSPITQGWFEPKGWNGSPSVGWNTLLIELCWPKLCSNGSRRGWIRLWPAGLNWHFKAETDLF